LNARKSKTNEIYSRFNAARIVLNVRLRKMTWTLRGSMNDRIAYDEMAHESGRASAIVLNDEDLERSDARQVACEVFEADLSANQVAVDDVEEARARWISAFAAGYREEQHQRKCEREEVA
jgi:hypothetical protein